MNFYDTKIAKWLEKHHFSPRIVISVMAGIAFSQNNSIRESQVIDQFDTVVFNVSQSVSQSGYVEFPVYFRSDDTVNALDFSFKFNTTKFAYDSVIRLAGYLSISANYNTTDSTLYFTSYSLQRITNDTPLVKVRLWLLSGQLCSGDLNSVAAYLNGDPCTLRVTNPAACLTDVVEIENKNQSLSVYPNPTTGLSNIKFNSSANDNAVTSLSDFSGRVVMNQNVKLISGDNNFPLDLNQLSDGIYILMLKSSLENSFVRIVKH